MQQAVRHADDHTWVVVVATEDREESSLQETLHRARQLAPRERIRAVMPAEHREWWRRPLWVLPASNVIAQPGTAEVSEGISQSMEKILERDSAAKVVLLPATRDAVTPVTRCAHGPRTGDTASVPA